MKGFISLTLPTIQPGHIDVVEFCKNRCNELLIGLTSDELCLRDNIDTVADFNTRSSLLKSIFPNIEIFCQNTWSGEDILRKHLPNIIFHSDNYTRELEDGARHSLKKIAKEINATLQEFSHRSLTQEINFKKNTASVYSILKRNKKVVGVDIYDKISAYATAKRVFSKDTYINSMWGSSLTFSASRLKEDTEFFSLQERIAEYAKIVEDIRLPLIVDGDTGGTTINLSKSIKMMDTCGIDCIVIEDKLGSKQNSLISNSKLHQLSDIQTYKDKFSAIRDTAISDNFIAIARLEGLICGLSEDEVAERALTICDAGASGVMVHTKDKDPYKVFKTIEIIQKQKPETLFMMVPQNIMNVTPAEWFKKGISILVYPNQMLRAAVSAYDSLLNRIDNETGLEEINKGLITTKSLIDIETQVLDWEHNIK